MRAGSKKVEATSATGCVNVDGGDVDDSFFSLNANVNVSQHSLEASDGNA